MFQFLFQSFHKIETESEDLQASQQASLESIPTFIKLKLSLLDWL